MPPRRARAFPRAGPRKHTSFAYTLSSLHVAIIREKQPFARCLRHPPALRSGGVKVALPNSEKVSHYEYQYIG